MPAPKWLTRPLWAGSGLQVSIASISAQAEKLPSALDMYKKSIFLYMWVAYV